MEQGYVEKLVSVVCGIIGGMFYFLKQVMLDMGYLESLWKAALTAIVCGFAGVAGKYLFTMVKNRIWKKRKPK